MRHNKIHPYLYIIFTFVSVIVIGTILLLMPFAYTDEYRNSVSGGDYFSNALFMASSAVCVTGLSVMPNGLCADMTIFGKAVMVVLMEIGGLSIITIAVFFFTIIGAKIGISNRYLLRESLNQNSVKGIINLVKSIVLLSLVVQCVGIVVNWYPIYEYTVYLGDGKGDLVKALLMSIFHAAASFNNAGFDVFSADNMAVFSSSQYMNYGLSYASMLTINLSTMFMIVIGGIGVVVLKDMFSKGFKWKYFTLHTKITIITTTLLIIIGACLLKLTCNQMTWLESFFTSITCRTAGFQTFKITDLPPASTLICAVLMIIGASPCSCGGGIKTTTFAIIIMAIFHYATGKKTRAFNRSVSDAQIFKAFVLVNIAVIICVAITGIVLTIQPGFDVGDTAFEVISAFSTTGLSRGITTSLFIPNKIILSFLMLFGRLGPLTVIGVVNKNWMSSSKEAIQYVEESVIIG